LYSTFDGITGASPSVAATEDAGAVIENAPAELVISVFRDLESLVDLPAKRRWWRENTKMTKAKQSTKGSEAWENCESIYSARTTFRVRCVRLPALCEACESGSGSPRAVSVSNRCA
jgi:hypothetical protein